MYGQNEICYTYDAVGNRVKRELCCTNCFAGSGAEDRLQAPATEAGAKLTLVPNPTAGAFRIETAGIPENAQVFVLDLAGKVLANRQLGDGQFDVSVYPAGTYIVSLQYGDVRRNALLEKSDR